MFEFIVKRTS